MSGFVAISREIFEDDDFPQERFSEREAWIWMICSSAWKPMKVRVWRTVLNLKRGQLAFSERFLAQRWGWTKSSVHRFLDRLEHRKMIVRERTACEPLTEPVANHKPDHKPNQITICNYDKYQTKRTTDRTSSGPLTEPVVIEKRTKEEQVNNITKEEPPNGAIEIEETVDKQYYTLGKKILGDKSGGTLRQLLQARGNDYGAAMAVLWTARSKQDAREYIYGVIRGTEREAEKRVQSQQRWEGIN